MTSENRLLFDLADILHVRVVCTKCKSAFSAAPDKWEKVPPLCVNCGIQWYIGDSGDARALERFKSSLEALRGVNRAGFTIQLEFSAHT